MPQKIAIFHQFLDNIGGAEIVTLTLARELKADVYTTNIDAEKIAKTGFSDVLPCIHSIGSVPRQAPFKHQAALLRFRYFRVKKPYDTFIISGDWAISAAVKNRPCIWYVHSPCRELWDLRKYVRQELMSPPKRPLFDLWSGFNRRLHPHYMKKINTIVCNSKTTQSRLHEYLGINAPIIHPPIDTKTFYSKPEKNYWLSVNRLLRHKRVEIQMKAFEKLPNERLIIVGSYEENAHQFEEYRKELELSCPPNVEIRHWVDDAELKELYAESKGLLATALNEDFGMSPVEAMASGKPVIAADEGGYRETILNGKTGLLIKDISPELLADALRSIRDTHTSFSPEQCTERARVFDTEKFISSIKHHINLLNT